MGNGMAVAGTDLEDQRVPIRGPERMAETGDRGVARIDIRKLVAAVTQEAKSKGSSAEEILGFIGEGIALDGALTVGLGEVDVSAPA